MSVLAWEVGAEVGMAGVGELGAKLVREWRGRSGAPGGAAGPRHERGGQAAAAVAPKVALAAVAAGLLVALLATGFHAAVAHLGERRARARGEAELAAMRVTLDDLQARLLVAQARVSHWHELQERRAEVTRLSKAAVAAHLAEQARAESELYAQARGQGAAAPRVAAVAWRVDGPGGAGGGATAGAARPGPPADRPPERRPGPLPADPAARPPEAPAAGLGGD